MSRPRNPAYDIPIWAPDANYPVSAKPWSATPTKVAHPGANSVGITPRTGVPAQVLNKLMSDAYATDRAAFEALVSLFNFVGQAPALTWRESLSLDHSLWDFAFYSRFRRGWVIVGKDIDPDVRICVDGARWGSNLVSAVGSGEQCFHSAESTSGVIVVSTDSRYVFRIDATDNALIRDAGGSSMTSTLSRVVFDHVRSKFLWISTPSSGTVAKSSSNGDTWSAATVSAEGFRDLASSPVTGRIVAVHRITSVFNGISLRRTDDVGATWAATSINFDTLGIALASAVRLHACDDGTWLLLATHSTYARVWRSADDGVTWTLATELLSDYDVKGIAACGELWSLVVERPDGYSDVAYSIDRGATWRKSGQVVRSSRPIYSGAGGFFALGDDCAYFSARFGMPDLGTLT